MRGSAEERNLETKKLTTLMLILIVMLSVWWLWTQKKEQHRRILTLQAEKADKLAEIEVLKKKIAEFEGVNVRIRFLHILDVVDRVGGYNFVTPVAVQGTSGMVRLGNVRKAVVFEVHTLGSIYPGEVLGIYRWFQESFGKNEVAVIQLKPLRIAVSASYEPEKTENFLEEAVQQEPVGGEMR